MDSLNHPTNASKSAFNVAPVWSIPLASNQAVISATVLFAVGLVTPVSGVVILPPYQ
ncbi:hypothetical protein ACA572_05375 [Lactiplantibacillus plantarum]|uniref:hypothetical protein n=1 Tax=Lactiplantibacillus plantarum TaxID=1590 RepID=UPI003C170EE3